ncbi:MAG: ferritin family protein [Dehalococcoidales bacterium]|nr:ferritin family protein [Dehalococcoidales bacterium]
MMEESLGKEFLEVAIEVERNGRAFYERVAGKTKSKEGRNVLLLLAGREKEHESNFQHILGHLGGYAASEYTRQRGDFIRDLAGSVIFISEKAMGLLNNKTLTDIEAVEAGIGMEKDSILFYSEIIGLLPKADRDIVDIIIGEEKKHLSELVNLADKLRSGT